MAAIVFSFVGVVLLAILTPLLVKAVKFVAFDINVKNQHDKRYIKLLRLIFNNPIGGAIVASSLLWIYLFCNVAVAHFMIYFHPNVNFVPWVGFFFVAYLNFISISMMLYCVHMFRSIGRSIIVAEVFCVVITVFLSVASLMASYASVFSRIGIMQSIEGVIYYDMAYSIYFSVITFTSVGYGDFVPFNKFGYVFSGLEAINGYVVMALLVGVLLKPIIEFEIPSYLPKKK